MSDVARGRGYRRLGPPRWRGQAGRLEVWYLTATDPVSGTGLWLHHEVVAPTGDAPARGHGWVALFPAGRAPVWRRFGPGPVAPRDSAGGAHGGSAAAWFEAGGATVTADLLQGTTEGATWALSVDDSGVDRPVWTFPRPAWQRELLPAAQVLAGPGVAVTGVVEVDGERLEVDGVSAGAARIYGHGNAERWGWLHAELGGGDVLELVTAVSRRAGLGRLPPATFAQLRIGGRDRFRVPLLPGPVELALPGWSVTGWQGRTRLRVVVDLPAARSVTVGYEDPDGAAATCTNSERADADIVLERWWGRWRTEATWSLAGTAHAEIGLR